MRTLSVDLRERILDAYDRQEGSREQIAHRFRVSLGMVKKLLQQRRRIADISPQHFRSGRKPMILSVHRSQMRSLLEKKSDLTLKELRQSMGLQCSLQAIHVVLGKMGLTYKKRHSEPANRTGLTLREHVGSGAKVKRASIRPG